MIAIDLSKQQALDADRKTIQQIDFTENLDREGNTRFYFILEEAKRNCFWIFRRNCKRFVNLILLTVILLNAKHSLIFISIKWHNTRVWK